ncbi:DUF3696 domain-containing protein [Sorangium sp. So ce426]|uniref:AAA family ATPase n=1 Tax=Sorangium sp. So ce426 TaxID=3133312 RepID=UPI003F5B08BA
MFTKLGLRNFKSWRGAHAFDLRPLTLVLGVNSAGKTSLLQPLLLLKQTIESPDRLLSLNLGGQPGEMLDLGRLSDVVSGGDVRAGLGFRLTFGPVSIGKGAAPRTLGSVDYEVEVGAAEDENPYVERLSYATAEGAYAVARQRDGAYALSAPGGPLPDDRRARRTYEPERSVGFSADAVAALGASGADAQDLALALTRELQRLAYLGPHRSVPTRHYAWTGRSIGQLGASGEHAIPALIASLVGRHADGSERGRLVEQVSAGLARLGIADRMEIERQATTFFQVMITFQGHRTNLLDVGFGVSQVLPVVTAAYFAPEGSTVIMSEPELHLHPLAQSALGDLLVEAVRERRVQLLVETHSEHLFRRIQTLMAEERITPDECAMYFARCDGGDSVLEPLEVNGYGRVANWPDKFFGDTVGEVERQMELMLDRMEKDEQRG